jgi:hypothetical protein
MAAQIFGAAVGNDINAEVQRILIDRSGKGVVDNTYGITGFGNLSGGFNVRD